MKIIVTDMADEQGHTPAEKDLTVLAPNGTEYTTDLIGNTGKHADADGVMRMTTDEYLWWDAYIRGAELTEAETLTAAELIKDEFGGDADKAAAFIRAEIGDQSNEMGDERSAAIRVINTLITQARQ